MDRKEQNIRNLIRERIKKKNPDADVILFGSHARGNVREESDWDILILLDEPNVTRKVERDYRDQLFDLELEVGEPFSVFVYSKSDWEQKFRVTPLYQNVQKEGVHL